MEPNGERINRCGKFPLKLLVHKLYPIQLYKLSRVEIICWRKYCISNDLFQNIYFLQIHNDSPGLLLKKVLKCDPQKNYLLVVASLTILQLKSLQCEIYCFKIIYEFFCWVRCVYKQSMLKNIWIYFWKPFWINFSGICFVLSAI